MNDYKKPTKAKRHWRNWLFSTLVILLSFFLACWVISYFFDVNWGEIWVLIKSFSDGVKREPDSHFFGTGHRLGGRSIGDWFRNIFNKIINSLISNLSPKGVRDKIGRSLGGQTVLRLFLGSFRNWRSNEEIWRLKGFILLDIFFCFRLAWRIIYYPVYWLVSAINSSFFKEKEE